MTSESLPVKSDTNIHPMVAYKRPLGSMDSVNPRQYYELGDRLNIDREALTAGLEGSNGFEMRDSPKNQVWNQHVDLENVHPPPIGVGENSPIDQNRLNRVSQMPSLPAVMARFKSPFEVASPTLPTGPTRVYVTTSQTVHHSP